MAASLNPLRCDGTALPPNLLLLAKLVALTLLFTNSVRLLPGLVLQLVFFAGAIALLFNRWVRLSSVVLGLTILFAVASSKTYGGRDEVLCGAMLLLTGLHLPGRSPWPLRLCMVIVYLRLGLSNLHSPYLLAVQLGLAVAFLFPRFYTVGIWGNLLFQSGMMFWAGGTSTVFFCGMTAFSLAFVDWPATRPVVIWDGDCGFCALTKKWYERIDLQPLFEWLPFQSGASERFGIPRRALEERLHLVVGTRIYAGFAACKLMILYNVLFYFAGLVLIVLPARPFVVALLLVFFFPLFSPAGEAVYNLVARNRHRLVADSHCKV